MTPPAWGAPGGQGWEENVATASPCTFLCSWVLWASRRPNPGQGTGSYSTLRTRHVPVGGSHLLQSSPCLTFEEIDPPERAGGLLGSHSKFSAGLGGVPASSLLPGLFPPAEDKTAPTHPGWHPRAPVCALCTRVLEDVTCVCQHPGLLPRGPPFASSRWLPLPSRPGPPHSVAGERAESGVVSWASHTWLLTPLSQCHLPAPE